MRPTKVTVPETAWDSFPSRFLANVNKEKSSPPFVKGKTGKDGLRHEVFTALREGDAPDGLRATRQPDRFVPSRPQKLQLGFPAGSSVRNAPPTEVTATVTSLAGTLAS